MKPSRQPLFVARRAYRRRRLIDAARMLPVLGFGLMVLPMLWAPKDGSASETATDGIYLFVIWGVLIVGARLLAPGLDSPPPDTPDTREG